MVIVTGGSRGLGLAVVGDLLAQGYRVATCSRNHSEGLERLTAGGAGPDALFWHPCTIGDEASEHAFFTAALGWGGEPAFWGLVNNAAIAGEGVLASFPTIDAARILEADLLGPLRLCRLALRAFLCRPGGGRIINVSSIVARRGYTGLSAYSAAKAGLEGLTRALARENGRRGITVNAVAPGYLETDLSASLDEVGRRQITGRTPLGRLGTVADVVPAIRFLLGPDAGFITGHTMVVDGGITC